MLRSLYTAATGMDAQQTKLDVIAHNLANSSTTGFKRARADFEDLLSETIRSATAPTAAGWWPPRATCRSALGCVPRRPPDRSLRAT
jgi:flagellar basal-body rod protein FlgG